MSSHSLRVRGKRRRRTTPEGDIVRESVLKTIVEYRNEHGYPPTIREIREEVGASSTSNISHHLQIMERDGVIERTPGVSRGIKVLVDDVY